MSERQDPGFGKFIPGFDFLQNLAKGNAQHMPQMANLSNWVAPTLNVEELDKRIDELKAVRFWLEQNSNALAATIQALEVQKMTLATLKGMNFSMGELADAMKLKTPAGMFGAGAPKAESRAAASPAPSQAPSPSKPAGAKGPKGEGEAQSQVVDPLQWWGALTQQFQQIATNAMQEVGAAAAPKAEPGKAKAAPAKKAGAAAKRAPVARRRAGKASGG